MTHSIMTEITKKMLAESLKKQMVKKPLNKITIKDIVDDCKLNRHTFYYHFRDIYELLSWMYKEEAIAQLRNHDHYNAWQEGFLNLFFYIENNKSICLCTFYSLGREHLEKFLYSVTYNLIQNVVNEVSFDLNVDDKHKNFVANFYTIAFLGIVIQWMQNGMKESPKDIIESLSITIHGNMRSALERYNKMKY